MVISLDEREAWNSLSALTQARARAATFSGEQSGRALIELLNRLHECESVVVG